MTLAVVAGLAAAVQARINGELAVRLDDGLAPGVISNLTGMAVLAVLVLLVPVNRRRLRSVFTARREGRLRWWHFLGGLVGGYVLLSQGLAVPALGVAVFTVGLIAGQTSSSLAVDRLGLAPSGVQRVTPSRLAGAFLCVVAVVLAVADQLGSPQVLALVVLPLLAGLGISWQQAVNGRLQSAAGSTWPATFLNFSAGMLAVTVAYTVKVAGWGWPAGDLPTEPWLYTSGLLGVLLIAIAAAVVRHIGVLLLAMSTVAGQLLGAMTLDLVAPTNGRPPLNTYLGVALALVAVLIAARRPAGPTGPAPVGPPPV